MKKADAGLLNNGLLLLSIILVLVIAPFVEGFLVRLSEDAMLALSPSAERAYEYGSRHFDAQIASSYDIEHAETFFNKARELDPSHALTYHQLARIAFLRGNFYKALGLIDASITLQGERINPSSYYVRGLILGFMGRYEEAAKAYERFMELSPGSWAAANDYAWVLLKAGRFQGALDAAELGLKTWPESPWLLNSKATALYELGDIAGASEAIKAAAEAAENITEEQWLIAYPGNDPRIALEGIEALEDSIAGNMHTILSAAEGSGL